MKNSKKFMAVFLAAIVCLSVLVIPASAATPRWANANAVNTNIDSSSDIYKVIVDGVPGTTKIEISATLKEKNILGIYVDKHTSSGTYYSRSATLTGYYDMSTSKDYKVSAVVYVTANGVREKIEV